MKQKSTKKEENPMYKTPDENTEMKKKTKCERQRRNEHTEKNWER